MPFKSDFISRLKKSGCLPVNTLEEIYELKDRSYPQSDQIKSMKKQVEKKNNKIKFYKQKL